MKDTSGRRIPTSAFSADSSPARSAFAFASAFCAADALSASFLYRDVSRARASHFSRDLWTQKKRYAAGRRRIASAAATIHAFENFLRGSHGFATGVSTLKSLFARAPATVLATSASHSSGFSSTTCS